MTTKRKFTTLLLSPGVGLLYKDNMPMLFRPNAGDRESQRNSGRGRGRVVWFGKELMGLGSEVKGKHCAGFRFCWHIHMLFCIAIKSTSGMWLKGQRFCFLTMMDFGSYLLVRLQTLQFFFSFLFHEVVFKGQWRHQDSSYPLRPCEWSRRWYWM